MPLPPQEHIVYGPVRSRRLGRSLGVNLLPLGMKVCNMNCAYCQYGWTRGEGRRTARRAKPRGWPTPAGIEAAVADRLERAALEDEILDRLTVAGHGEATLHPDFEEIAKRLEAVRDRFAPGIKLAILSNSTTATWPDVQSGLAHFDERFMKLDAGDPITYARINGPGPSVTDIVEALATLPPVIVQSMFVTDGEGKVDNTTEGAVTEWVAAVRKVKPSHVHIFTINRAPAAEYLRPVAARRLREIAEHLRSAGISADVFPPQSS